MRSYLSFTLSPVCSSLMKSLMTFRPALSVVQPKLQTTDIQKRLSIFNSFSLALKSLASALGSSGNSILRSERKTLSKFVTSQFWLTGTGVLIFLMHISTSKSTLASKSSLTWLALSRRRSGKRSSHDSSKTCQPMSTCSMKTIPQRETVAGEACDKSCVSNIIVDTGLSLMISPLFKHSFLLSSSTVFMFSIHTASTGPSNANHFRSSV
mmetsp:Transcript_18950/g.44244  ORF Transcript_18950/g.44244 Transcript_18950/m.44244 type:complete len:210 (-) Transcript_18950:278-907(-)